MPAQPAYGYPQPVAAATAPARPTAPPAAPPVLQQPQQGYPAYGYPQPVAASAAAGQHAAPGAGQHAGRNGDGAFTLPPQGPQFQTQG